jgi:trehalose 6-phosphate synthase
MLNLTICSHRGPIGYDRTSTGTHARRAGPGGLVAAVAPAASRVGATWLYAASTDGDRQIARRHPGGIEHEGMLLRLLDLPASDHRAHYEVISSALLAPLFHYLFSLTYAPAFTSRVRGAWAAYRRINELFGDAVRTLPTQDVVLVEDTQLMLVGMAIRGRPNPPDVPLAYFHHVPWCDQSYFGILPEPLRREILSGMLTYDSLGFHCWRWAEAFIGCCERFLPGARGHADGVEWHGNRTNVAIIPAAIDSHAVRASAESTDASRWRNQFQAFKGGRRLFVRVERADPSKNAIRGLRAYQLLLERRPDFASTTRLLAVITPVRGWVDEYREYLACMHRLATEINERFAREGAIVWLDMAKDAHLPDHARAVAALAVADVLVVNPTFDGLNLVAMEGAVAGNAALVLSENAGSHDLLKSAALSVNPFDIDQTADAMEQAVEWSETRRCHEAARLLALVTARTPEQWILQRVDHCIGRPPPFLVPDASSLDTPY